MTKEKEMTAPIVSVGADTEQSSQNLTNHSLTDFDSDFKGSDDDFYREIQRRMAPDYLETVPMVCWVRQTVALSLVRRNAPPMQRCWMSPAEIRRISGCT